MDYMVLLSDIHDRRHIVFMGAFGADETTRGGRFDGTHGQVRKEFISDRATSMLAVVPPVMRSDYRVEIAVVAAAPGSATTGQDE